MMTPLYIYFHWFYFVDDHDISHQGLTVVVLFNKVPTGFSQYIGVNQSKLF